MPYEPGLNRISLRIDSELFRQLDKKRFEEDTTFQNVGVGLLKQWLDGELPGPEHELVTMMREYVKLSDPEGIKCLRGIIYRLISNAHHRAHQG
jgi:hypothetical protein